MLSKTAQLAMPLRVAIYEFSLCQELAHQMGCCAVPMVVVEGPESYIQKLKRKLKEVTLSGAERILMNTAQDEIDAKHQSLWKKAVRRFC
jgi:hypothetical protein